MIVQSDFAARPSLIMPALAQEAITIAASVAGLIVLIIVVRRWRTTGESYPFFLLVGAMACTFYEPFVVTLAHFHYPEIGQRTSHVLLGVAIPLFHPIIAMSYMGGVVLWIFFHLDDAKLTVGKWWAFFTVTTLFALAFEPPLIHIGLWKYYGDNQSLSLLGMPVIWSIANAAALMWVGLFAYLAWDRMLQRTNSWSLVLLVPMGLIAFHMAISAPVYIALNSTLSVAINNLAAAVSALFATGAAYLGARALSLATEKETLGKPTKPLGEASQE